MRRVWVLFGIAVGVVFSVENRVRSWHQKRCPLTEECEGEEKSFPSRGHRKHTVRDVPMQEERLTENGQRPMGNEEREDDGHGLMILPEQCQPNVWLVSQFGHR